MQPGDRTPAPAALAPVQRFMNTVDLLSGIDLLLDPASVHGWFQKHALLTAAGSVSEEEYRRALAFRAALRSLAQTHAQGVTEGVTEGVKDGDADGDDGEAFDPATVSALTDVAQRALLGVQVSRGGGMTLASTATGVDGVFGRMLVVILDATRDGTWARLKACANPGCQWVFYDASKNRSSAWCTMKMCGSQHKARAYRQRRKARASASTTPS